MVLVKEDADRAAARLVALQRGGESRAAVALGDTAVPLDTRTSEEVAGRNSYRLSPGAVDIAVLPPIDVSDWTHDDLPKRIKQVRDLYLETLADWPVPEPDGNARRPS